MDFNNFSYKCIQKGMEQHGKKFLIWCLDEVNHSLDWKTHTGPIYRLPRILQNDIFPWLAHHLWYDKDIGKNNRIAG